VLLGCEIGQGWYFGKPMPPSRHATSLPRAGRGEEAPVRNVING
jgi:EAL domain-containing protein (putative c-di-GMP-specific phosphodiesterase class I)